jgi:hypothetical protein
MTPHTTFLAIEKLKRRVESLEERVGLFEDLFQKHLKGQDDMNNHLERLLRIIEKQERPKPSLFESIFGKNF